MVTMMLMCDVCPRECKLVEGKTGFCGVRTNINGVNKDALYGIVYLRSEGPTHHTLALPGCNLQCPTCIDPFLSRYTVGSSPQKVSAMEAVDFAVKHQKLLTFFGGEPALHYEYVLATAQLYRERGGVCDLYTSGYINQRILSMLSKAVDAVHVGVKASTSRKVYDRMTADPAIILQSIKTVWHDNGDIWVRNLVGPELSPTREEDERFAEWLLENTDLEIPVLMEPMVQPLDNVPTHDFTPALGDDFSQMRKRCMTTALIFFRNGLSNVWIVGYLTRGVTFAKHVPSGRPFKFMDGLSRRYRALGYPDKENDPAYQLR